MKSPCFSPFYSTHIFIV